jgi:hypothetical protein
MGMIARKEFHLTASETIQSLTPLAEILNSESDGLNATITALSEKLAALNLGIEVWSESREDTNLDIGFAKVEEVPQTEQGWPAREYGKTYKSRWQLVTANRQHHGDPTPLLRASRDVRIEGLGMVPYIVAQLKGEAEAKIRIIQEAKKLAAGL